MDRQTAIGKLSTLVGQDIHTLAMRHKVQVLGPSGKVNKGWAGHVIERFLGLPINSAQAPNFGSWELKVIPLKRLQSGELVFKETMAITMIDPVNVGATDFDDSHLLTKLRRAVIVARIVGENVIDPSVIHSITALDLVGKLKLDVEKDYEDIRACINDKNRGFNHLTGAMGKFIQPRTKGAGHGSTSRAFYARPFFLEQFIDLT